MAPFEFFEKKGRKSAAGLRQSPATSCIGMCAELALPLPQIDPPGWLAFPIVVQGNSAEERELPSNSL